VYINHQKPKKMRINKLNLPLRSRIRKSNLVLLAVLSGLFYTTNVVAQSELIEVERFDEVVISPHIEVVFREGNESSVVIEEIEVPMNELNVTVSDKKLHLYLDDAKITSPPLKDQIRGNCTLDYYDGTIVRAIVTYERLESVDLRGEQKFVFESKIDARKLRLKLYGETEVLLNKVDIDDLRVSMYGESELEILDGQIQNQVYKVYGESEVDALAVDNEETKVTVYGEGEFKLNVSEKLIVTSYGEASIEYSGKAKVDRRIIIGDTEITRLDNISVDESTDSL